MILYAFKLVALYTLFLIYVNNFVIKYYAVQCTHLLYCLILYNINNFAKCEM